MAKNRAFVRIARSNGHAYMCACKYMSLYVCVFCFCSGSFYLVGLIYNCLVSSKEFKLYKEIFIFFIFGVNNKNSDLLSFNWKLCENR